MALTPKQEKFCQNIVSGMDNITSYMSAYDCQSRNAANTESNKLLMRDDITERIIEIRKPVINLIQNKQISEREKQIKEIKQRIEICKQKEDEQSLIRYYDMLNKIYSLYKESDTEQKPESAVNNLDISTLKRLSGIS